MIMSRNPEPFVQLYPTSLLVRELEDCLRDQRQAFLLQIKLNQAPQVARLLEPNHLFAEEELIGKVGDFIKDAFERAGIYRIGKHTFMVRVDAGDGDFEGRLRAFAQRCSPLEVSINDTPYFPKLNIGATPVAGSIAETITRLEFACDLAFQAAGANVYIAEPDDPGPLAHIELRRGLRDVRVAIREGHIGLYAQPIVGLGGEPRVVKKELLMRHFVNGEARSPLHLLQRADYNRIAQDLDLHIAELLARNFSTVMPEDSDIDSLSLNISGMSYSSPGFTGKLTELFTRYAIPKNRIVLEITENIANQNTENAIATMEELKAEGFRLALDDIGVGSSNFRNLFRFPVDYFKIDRSYCLEIGDNATVKAFVQIIIDEAKRTGRETIAEGIPDQETLAILEDMGADFSQSFITGEPEPFIAAPSLCDDWACQS